MKNILLYLILMTFFVANSYAQKTTIHRNENGVVVKITSDNPAKNVRIDKHKVENYKIKRTVVVKKPLNSSVGKQETIADNSTSDSKSQTPLYEVRYAGSDDGVPENSISKYETLSSSSHENSTSTNQSETTTNNVFHISSGNKSYRDERGFSKGESSTDSHGNTTYRDERGFITGSASTDSHGNKTYRDERGFVKGTATSDSHGNTTYRDERGFITGTASTDSQGNITYRDERGFITGTATTDSNGNITYRNASGFITGTSSR